MDNTSQRRIAAQALGERIRAFRTERGLSQESLAEAVGVTRMAVSLWETGSRLPGSLHLMGLAQALDIPLGDLGTLTV